MIKYLFILISFVLDFLILNYLNAAYLFPMFTIMIICLLYSFFKIKKEYDITVMVLSLVYGMIFLNNIALGFFLFFALKEVIVYINDKSDMNVIKLLLLGALLVIVYDTLLYLFLFMPFNVFYLVDKILKSLLLNAIYILIMYPIIFFSSKYQ